MKKLTSYPHPVLGNGDDLTRGRFGLARNSLTYSITSDEVRIQGSFELEHETLEALLEARQAALLVRLDCPRTSFRHLHRSDGWTFDVVLPSESVRSRIHLEAVLVACCDIPDYQPLHTNPLYGPAPEFSIQEGDLLAFAGSVSLPINLKFDPLVSPLGSIIRLQAVPDRAEVGLELLPEGIQSEYFVILIPQEMWELVSNYRATPAIISNLILPSLVEVLHVMREAQNDPHSEITSTDWYANLLSLLNHRQLDLDGDVLETAQRLLSAERSGTRLNPITQAFASLT